MRIKPKFDKTYLIRYRRGKDVQTTEVVETTWDELRTMIAQTFRSYFRKQSASFVPATQIQVVELDNVAKTSHMLEFEFVKDGKEFRRAFATIYNQSPREVRIRLEKEINNLK